VSDNFAHVVVVDFEYETGGGEYDLADGDLPVPLCMVAHVLDEGLRHVRTIKIWRGDFGRAPPFDTGPDTLVVAYSAWAEMTCFQVLGWKFPIHIFDLHTAYLAASNLLLPYEPNEVRKRQRKRLSDACRAYGIQGWENIDKEEMARAIGEGRWREYGQDAVFDYCEEDVRKSAELLRAQLRGHGRFDPASVPHVLHWSNYSAKAVAQIQARGMPIDVPLWNLIQENKAAVVRYLLERLDPSHGDDDPIYNEDGEWSYARFETWLASRGVIAWPRLDSGALDTDSDAFRLMYHIPGIENLHALRDSLGVIVRARIPIGRDGRNRASLFPFCTATSRNAQARSLYNAHAGMRGLMVFPRDKIGVYLDWRTQEVAIAAALSEDKALIDAYAGGDIYHNFALVCGMTTDPDRKHWKDNNPEMRQRMKTLQLGINYGMGVPSLARGLNRHPLIASAILEMHKRTYPRFWQWREENVWHAMLTRRSESIFGWPLHISTSPNRRTLYNFPVQSGGAEMLRLAAVRLCDGGIVPCMLVHDGILIEARDREEVEHAIEIMRAAGRTICNGLEVGVDIDQMLEHGARYADKRPMAKQMWGTIMQALQEVGADAAPEIRNAS
jgi:DNA polymerase family A